MPTLRVSLPELETSRPNLISIFFSLRQIVSCTWSNNANRKTHIEGSKARPLPPCKKRGEALKLLGFELPKTWKAREEDKKISAAGGQDADRESWPILKAMQGPGGFDRETFWQMITFWLSRRLLPNTIVEHPEFRAIIRYLRAGAEPPSEKTVRTNASALYNALHEEASAFIDVSFLNISYLLLLLTTFIIGSRRRLRPHYRCLEREAFKDCI